MFRVTGKNIFQQGKVLRQNFVCGDWGKAWFKGLGFRCDAFCSVLTSFFSKTYFVILMFALAGCGLEKKLAQMSRDVPFDVQIAQDQFYEGQDTSIQISLLKTYPEEKTLSWRIEDANGNIADASAFAVSSGEITLNGNEPVSFSVSSLFGASGGEVVGKTYDLVIASNGLEKRFHLNLMNAGTASVLITGTDNLGYVNDANKASYTVSGTCSAEGGAVSLKASSGGTDVTQSTTCVSLAWSMTLDYSSLDEGVVSLTATHTSSTGAQGTSALAIQKDTVIPTLSIDTPVALSYINVANTAAFTLGGTCSENAKSVALTFTSSGGGLAVVSSATCAAGTWSKTLDLSALANGTISVSGTHTDTAGNSVAASSTFVKDSLAPGLVFVTPAHGAYVKNPNPTLTGSCEDGLSIVISGSGVSSPGSGVCSASSFSIAATLTSGDGSKVVTLTQTDSAGNTTTQTHTFTLDTVAPALSFTSAVIKDQTTNTNTITFTGSCEAGVAISVGGGTDSSSTTCTLGSWSYTVSSQSMDALRTYTFDQIDLAGNPSTITGTWLRDATLPAVTLTSLTGGEFIKGGSTTNITWSASDANLTSTPITLEYSTNGGSTWIGIASDIANSGSYAWSVPAINASSVKVKVTAKDILNTNTDQSATSFVIDSSNPVVTLTALNGGQVLKGGATQNITWTATDANLTATPISLDYTQDGTTWVSIATNLANSGSYTWTVPSLDGSTFKVRVTALDQVSNTASATSTAPFSIDSTNPAVTLTSLTGGQTIGSTGSVHAITWTASDAHMTATSMGLYYSDNSGSSWTSIASNLSNSGTYSWSVSLADGTHYRVKVVATDSVGNVGESSSSSDFTITSQAPNLTQTTLTSPYVSNSATTVTFGGACDLSATMVDTTITISGTQSATATCTGTAPTGAWSWTTSSQSSDASRNYSFAQTNMYGVTSTVNATWIRDTVAPEVSAVLINNDDSYMPTTIGSIGVTASDAAYSTGLQVRMATTSGAATNCQTLYADDSWNDQINATMTWVASFPDGDGVKKVCVWAKDKAGNVSVISPSAGTLGVDMDTVNFANSSPPQILSFNVSNSADGSSVYNVGEGAKISWSVSDSLGLANDPIKLEYTTDGSTWNTFEAGYGSLSGNPTTYSTDYYGFNAPSASFFRIRITAKNVAGQTSIAVISPPQNTGNWSVYAGTTDRGVGGSARSALFVKPAGSYNKHAAFNPENGDIYIEDHDSRGGILKIDARTGIVSKFMAYGTTNLPNDGAMPANPTFLGNGTQITFDHNGLMYLMETSTTRTSTPSRIFQINLKTNYVRLYLGSSTASKYDNTATPSTVFVVGTDFTFDESNTMYFVTTCLARTTWDGTHGSSRLMKVTQNVDGTPGTVSIVAGDCTQASPVSGSVATATGFSSYGDLLYTSIAAWDNGNTIYYSDIAQGTFKILNGTVYSTLIPRSLSLIYSPFSGKLYWTDYLTRNSIKEYSVNTSGADGESITSTIVDTGGTGGCNEEGVDASATCMNMAGGLVLDPQGKLYFEIGASTSPVRLAYVNGSGHVSVMAGTLPFNGDGLSKNLIRGNLSGIYYKQAGEANQTAFPEGLYFSEYTGPVLGYVDPATGVTSVLAGNQTGSSSAAWATGTALSKDLSMGSAGYQYGRKITFDNQGLPWFTYTGPSGIVVSVDANKQIVQRQNASNSYVWDYRSTSSSPTSTSMFAYGGESNLSLKGAILFLLARTVYNTYGFTQTDPVLRALDFANGTITQLMGNGGTTASPDTVVRGPLTSLDFSGVCVNTGCKTRFVENNSALASDDLLYFTEGTNLRVISDPTTPSNSLLTTVFTAASTISNFIVAEDQSQVFYTMGGRLYCHALIPAGNKSWCNDTSLGPPTGMSLINTGPDQMTWMDAQTLLISNYTGEIYQFNVPQTP